LNPVSSIFCRPINQIKRIYTDQKDKGEIAKTKPKRTYNKKGPKEEGFGSIVDIYV